MVDYKESSNLPKYVAKYMDFCIQKKIPFIAVAFIAVTFIARPKSPFKMNGNDLFSPPNSLYSKREITFLALKDFLV